MVTKCKSYALYAGTVLMCVTPCTEYAWKWQREHWGKYFVEASEEWPYICACRGSASWGRSGTHTPKRCTSEVSDEH